MGMGTQVRVGHRVFQKIQTQESLGFDDMHVK